MNELPKTIGPYDVVQRLGNNGWLETFEAVERRSPSNRVVVRAVPQGLRNNPETVEMFRRNIGKLARLCHPNIFAVEYHDPDNLFYAVQFQPGTTLDGHLRHGGFSLDHALSIIRNIGLAIAHAHKRDIFHGELSADCVFLTENGPAMLKNFSEYVAPLDVAIIPRNPIHLSPEAVRGEKLDGRADVYGLGSLLWEMLCRRPPFRSSKNTFEVLKQKVLEPPPSARWENPNVPVYLDAVIRRAMAINPNERFQTVSAFLEAIETVPDDFSAGASHTGFGLAIMCGNKRGKLIPIPAISFFIRSGWGTEDSKWSNYYLEIERPSQIQLRFHYVTETNKWYLFVFNDTAGPTLLNGQKCPPNSTVPPEIAEGDVISIGQTEFVVVRNQPSAGGTGV